MNDPLVLVFDVGTQSVRCLLVTPDGEFLDKEQLTYETPYFSREPGWAEQRPDFYFEQMAEISRKLLARPLPRRMAIHAQQAAATRIIANSRPDCMGDNRAAIRHSANSRPFFLAWGIGSA